MRYSNTLEALVSEVYAEHEGRIPVQPRLRTSSSRETLVSSICCRVSLG